MEIFSIFGSNGIQTETWNFRDKQGESIFGDVKVMDISFESNGKVVSQPVEEGSFFSYNKTGEPNKITNTLAFEGTAQYLQSVLNMLKKYKESMDLFSVVTPYCEYENMSLESYSYTRDVTNGYGVLYVPINCVEVKEVKVAYSSTDVSELPPPIDDSANPSDASTQDTGMTSTTSGSSQTQESAKKSRSALREGYDWWKNRK